MISIPGISNTYITVHKKKQLSKRQYWAARWRCSSIFFSTL